MTMLKKTIFLILMFCLTSCAMRHNVDYKKILPRQSFVKLEKELIIRSCSEGSCMERDFSAVASGVVIQNRPEGSYVLTAAHVCDERETKKEIEADPSSELKIDFYVVTLDLKRKPVRIVKFDNRHDVCLVWVKDLFEPQVTIAPRAPVPGDLVLNIAAPLGVFSKNMVPIFQGFYNGTNERDMGVYSLPAFGGSSGSPIFNQKGELIGMVHSVIRHFNNVALSPSYQAMREFINGSLEEDMSNRYFRSLLRPFLNI